MINVTGFAVGHKIKRFRGVRNASESVRVFPFAGTGTRDQVIRDALFQELGLRAAFHRPVVPLDVQFVEIKNAGIAEIQPADFFFRCARSCVVPRPDDQVVILLGFGAAEAHVRFVVGEGARLIAVVVAGNGENRNLYSFVSGLVWHHRVVVRILRWMLQPFLKYQRGIAHDFVEILEGEMLVVIFAGFRSPVGAVAEQAGVAGCTAREREPLHIVGREDTERKRKVDAGMSCGSRNDGGKMRRKFLERSPLIESGIRTAPHRDFAVAPRLLGKPFHDIVAVSGLVRKRLKGSAGIAASAHVNQSVDVAVLREVNRAIQVAVGNVRRQGEDRGEWVFLPMGSNDGGIQLNAVAQRDFRAPLHVDFRRRGCRCLCEKRCGRE